ncbi:hypothetical protein QQ054_16025 [Oscillatoria amoena NRMC-F 0135]|nr:hypothetical protein [Oscillatoria laete-virens]MDL5047524.1 hypothetical protein [Oscillatoria amoena NRMC-F 0135]MDL5054652.1 hypothetical protein [Oscillatoria laete-virens NRMC-F 0139]
MSITKNMKATNGWLIRRCAAIFGVLIFLAMSPSANAQTAKLPGSFHPAQIAGIETRMWRAYYRKDYPTLVNEGLMLLRTQFGIPQEKAVDIAADLAKAAYTFSTSQGSYEQNVLPELSRAYEEIRLATGAKFSSESVAKAEIAWWKARRTPGQNSPENVGRLIGELYFELYGLRNDDISRAALLRAEAAAARDQSKLLGREPDWKTIEGMLDESYTLLVRGLGTKSL